MTRLRENHTRLATRRAHSFNAEPVSNAATAMEKRASANK
jgi:hypothetical protein